MKFRGTSISLKEGRLNYFRSLLLLGSIGLPVWALYHEFTIFSIRIFFGILSALLFLGSYKISFLKKNLDKIIYVLICVSVAPINKTLFTSDLDPIWAIYHITIFFGLSAVFRNLNWLVAFVLLYSIGTVASSIGAVHPNIDPFKFLFLYGCSVTIMLIIAYSYTWTTLKIDKYAHGTAHHLRAPVARIRGLIELYKLDKSNHPTYLKLLEKEVEDLNNITKDHQKNLE